MAQNLKDAIVSFASDIGFNALSQLIDQVPQLEKNIGEKDDRIKALSAQLDTERKHHAAEQQKELKTYSRIVHSQEELEDVKRKGRELEVKYKAKITKLKEKEQDIVGLRQQLQQTQASANKSSKELSESQSRVAKLEDSLEKSISQHDSLEKEFNVTNSKLSELLSFAAPLYDVDLGTMAKELESLWKSTTLVVGRFLRQDLPDEMLQNDWDGLRDTTIFKLQIPLPQSNSEAAKETRIATVLGVLARLVDKYIFQPTYILDDSSGLRGVLRRQAVDNDRKESFIQGMFLSMFPEEQESEREAKTRRDWVIDDLIADVGVHFLAPEAIGTFRMELEDVVVQAQESWRTVQYSKQRLEPSFRYTPDTNLGWQTFEFQVAREGEQPMSLVTANDLEDLLLTIIRSF